MYAEATNEVCRNSAMVLCLLWWRFCPGFFFLAHWWPNRDDTKQFRKQNVVNIERQHNTWNLKFTSYNMVNTSVAYKLSMLVNQVQLIKYCIPPRSECDYGMQSHQFMPKKPLHEPYNLSINSFIEVHNHVYNWIFVRTGILISCVLLHPTVAAAPKILGGPRRVRLGGPDSPQVKL